MVTDAIEYFLPDYVDIAENLLEFLSQFFIAGVLFAFILWAIAIAVRTAYGWLSSWTSARE